MASPRRIEREWWVVVDALGEPVHPEWFSDELGRVLTRAGLPRIVLREARHTALSPMEKSGVPISIISKWAGHHDVRFTYSVYVHAEEDDLAEGTAAVGCTRSTEQCVKECER